MKVLVVEDEHRIANSIKKGLNQESIAVDVAYDGETGYDLASIEGYDVVVLDLMCPKLDGVEVGKKLREEMRVWAEENGIDMSQFMGMGGGFGKRGLGQGMGR